MKISTKPRFVYYLFIIHYVYYMFFTYHSMKKLPKDFYRFNSFFFSLFIGLVS